MLEEKSVKHWLKRKVKFTEALLVAFLITGGIASANVVVGTGNDEGNNKITHLSGVLVGEENEIDSTDGNEIFGNHNTIKKFASPYIGLDGQQNSQNVGIFGSMNIVKGADIMYIAGYQNEAENQLHSNIHGWQNTSKNMTSGSILGNRNFLIGTTESNTPLQDLNTKYNLGIDTKGLSFLYLVATPKTNVMNNIIGNENRMGGSNLSSVIGSLNNIMNSDLSDVHGVNNNLTADKENGSSYAMLSGYGNEGKNIQHTTIIGSENTVENGSSNVVIGDKHKLTKVSNSVILGSTDQETETTVSDVVSIGHNAKVEKEGGIALGSSSVANREKGQAGFDITKNTASTNESATWKATYSALSIGDGNTVTRQITGVAAGSEDTDAVNVAQLKALKESTEENTKEMTKQLNHLGKEIDSTRSETRHVGALSASLAALHPMQYDPLQKSQVMAGVGTYRDKQAIAVGVAHYFNENLMMTAGVSLGEDTRTKTMANLGLTWKIGSDDDRKDLPERYKEGPIGSIYKMQQEMEAILNENQSLKVQMKEQQKASQKQDEKIERLEKQLQLLLNK